MVVGHHGMSISFSELLQTRMIWEPDVQKLIQQLDVANKKIDEYTQLIISLFAELKLYRDTICVSCKENVLHATGLTSVIQQQSAATTLYESTPAPLESGLPTVVETRSEPSSPLTLSPRGSGPTHSDDSFYTASQSTQDPSTTTSPELSSPIVIAPIISVDYNPEIEKTIDLSVVVNLTFPSRVYAVKFSRDGEYFAVGLGNGEAHIYDVMTMSKSVLAESGDSVIYSEAAVASKGRSALRTIRFSPDNNYIATGREDGQIKIKRKRVRVIFKGHTRYAMCIDFSPNGRFLASASLDGTIRMWCIRDGSLKYPPLTIETDFNSVAFSPNGLYLAGGGDDYRLRIWNSRTVQLLKKWEVGTGVWSVAFQPDGKRIASGGNDCAWKSWDLSSLQSRDLRSSGRIVDDEPEKVFTCRGHKAPIHSISFSPDGQWVVSSGDNYDNDSIIWDALTGVWVCTLRGHSECVWEADISPVGQYIVTGSADCQVVLWRYAKLDK